MNYSLIQGNSLEKLKDLEDNSIDSIVTDPPYELGFMGKSWDKSGIAYNVELWKECLRVLKPGGHLLAFSGTRTYHRMTVAIEDVGFEIRDQIQWLYGSGFPKSTDVSKQIDKKGGNNLLSKQIGDALKKARIDRGLTAGYCDKKYCAGTTNWSWYEGRPSGQRMPDYETLLNISYDWDEIKKYVELVSEAEREVIGKHRRTAGVPNVPISACCGNKNDGWFEITKPSTPEAQKWQGWGTALKPANEPICVARKPLSEKTIAENVLKWGVGAINIDECRVGNEVIKGQVRGKSVNTNFMSGGVTEDREGRWPANVIHDGSDEVVSLFPHTKSGLAEIGAGNKVTSNLSNMSGSGIIKSCYADSGSASRFFYCAKASKKDRGENNNHPTVKPTDLMAYLVRLVTPPGGTVLDPFNGSGSTGKACARLDFNYIGIDLSQEYLDISKARIEAELSKK